MRWKLLAAAVCTMLGCVLLLVPRHAPEPDGITREPSILDPHFPHGEDPMRIWNGVRTVRPGPRQMGGGPR